MKKNKKILNKKKGFLRCSIEYRKNIENVTGNNPWS